MDATMENKEQGLKLEEKDEQAKEEVREIPDEKLEHVSGGTTPIIRPF
jgi:hypothetical protein